METTNGALVAAAATHVLAAYVSKRSIPADEIPAAVLAVAAAFSSAGDSAPQEPQTPAANLRRLVKPDAVICAECGHSGRTLKRHLAADHGLTPDAYRTKWALPYDHPMVAPSYSRYRSELAHSFGLGKKRAVVRTARSRKKGG